mmetsp:Transcript_44316/g.94295  ORF Transcript_44316/g.94295 Transcript_44316/m.94295 type:complete len:113 (-) Transcript_44316:171-509(-)
MGCVHVPALRKCPWVRYQLSCLLKIPSCAEKPRKHLLDHWVLTQPLQHWLCRCKYKLPSASAPTDSLPHIQHGDSFCKIAQLHLVEHAFDHTHTIDRYTLRRIYTLRWKHTA